MRVQSRLKSNSTAAGAGFLPELRGMHIFALIFTAIFLLHLPLLRLPYFWDEAGYYIPAAYDLFTGGHVVPQSVPSNAHPPLLSVYLAVWWKLSAFKPAVTRIAMLLLAALSLEAVFRLARMLTNARVAVAVVACTAVYPVWFAQSSLAHADVPAATFALWGLFFYFRSLVVRTQEDGGPILLSKEQVGLERRHSNRNALIAAVLFTFAALSKETVVIIPLILAGYDIGEGWPRTRSLRHEQVFRPLLLVLSLVPLAAWFIYHHHRTGFFFGNPEFFAYNVSGALTAPRVVLSLAVRLWQTLGYMNLWLLALATFWVMRYPPLQESDGSERKRIALVVQYRIAAILAGNVVAFSLVGGAALARYLLPAYPLVILIGISTLRRRLREWTWAVLLIAAGFVLALFSNPFGYIPPEDNLSYRNYVILHKEAADYLQQRDPHARVLTAWTATDELTKPFLGYVREPMPVIHVDNFSYDQLGLARMASGQYDLALLFSTKQEPSASLLDRWAWWERMSRKYFGFHRDLPPEVAAQVLGGRVTWERKRGQQWIAVVSFDQVENAELSPTNETRSRRSFRFPCSSWTIWPTLAWSALRLRI
jgi:4-amino-4-deoxy-L-arabinose transferase-like glycosyltransferase